jgi:DNA repair exonuclease SbcCD ATPase subunit
MINGTRPTTARKMQKILSDIRSLTPQKITKKEIMQKYKASFRTAYLVLKEAKYKGLVHESTSGTFYRTSHDQPDETIDSLVDQSADRNVKVLQRRNEAQIEIISKLREEKEELENKLETAVNEAVRVSDELRKAKADIKTIRDNYKKAVESNHVRAKDKMVLHFIEDMVNMGLKAIGEKK